VTTPGVATITKRTPRSMLPSAVMRPSLARAWLSGLAVAAVAAGCSARVSGTGPGTGSDAAAGAADARRDDGGSARTCKRGVGYNHEDARDQPALSRGIGWWYDWGTSPDAGAAAAFHAAGIEYVPMIWTGPPRANIDVAGLIDKLPADVHYLLGFNEPNFGAQANLTPAQAAAAWPQLEQIASARGLALVSPAVNYCGGNCNETDPFKWLDAFFAACTGCRVDYVAFHWYACSKDALTAMLGRFEAYGRPVWLTEFACLDAADTSEAVQEAYLKQAVPVLEADAKVFRYAWFIGRSSPGAATYDLLGAPGALSPLGQTYVGEPGACMP
jgi:Glycosyl hydrolase catalytic core